MSPTNVQTEIEGGIGIKKQPLPSPEELKLMSMKPTERWINQAPIEACIAEWGLIQAHKSSCSSKQRQYIQERVEQHYANQK